MSKAQSLPTRGEKFIGLSKAPIVEAVLDIRIQPLPEESLAACARFIDSLPEQYSGLKEEMVTWEHRFAFGNKTPDEEMGTFQRLVGYRKASSEGTPGRQFVQARLDGFTLNRLEPYDSWSSLAKEARELWNAYRNCVGPTSVLRLALRYINRIELPVPIERLEDYFNTLPVLAPNLGYSIGNHLMRFEVSIPEIQAGAVINCTTCAASSPELVGFSLDIDVFKSKEVPQAEPEIWSTFEQLRDEKNLIFFSSITPTTRNLLQ